MNPSRRTKYLRLALALASVCFVLLAVGELGEVWARVGGGGSYSGGRGGGSGGGEGAGAIVYLIFRVLLWLTIEVPIIGIPIDIFVVGMLLYIFVFKKNKTEPSTCSSPAASDAVPTLGLETPSRRGGFVQEFNQLRRFDPNFSEIIFTDFAYALYAKAHEARGRGAEALDLLSPYLSDEARTALLQSNPPNLQAVVGIIVGSMQIGDVRGLATPLVNISIDFETNYTEVVADDNKTRPMSYYVRERWLLERKRDVLSPTPEQAVALHCPRCGAALEKNVQGACAFCGAKIESGEFQWYVRSVQLLSREARGPLLTSDVPEVGTDFPSVIQPGLPNIRANFERSHPEFTWPEFEARAQLIFNELQAAWSSLDWERARPHETDSIFQMHRYWIEEYKRQGLRNALDGARITSMQPVKIKEDTFYNAVTLRIWAEGYDYTVDGAGKIVSGSNKRLRQWSEYWTFIRNRNAKPAHARADLNCPNCGAPLKVNATGICEYCRGKVTSGEFDWVLSKIEQDESYAG
jgi:hypothetical protein